MVFNIVIPEINSKPRNTKDAVISLLIVEWPLSLKAIFYGIKKRYGYSSSYQAVYNAIKELMKEDVVLGKDKRYWLNIDWIKRLQSFTDIAETNYYAKERINQFSGMKDANHKGDVMILNFETLFDAEKYLYYFMKSELNKTEKDIVCQTNNHLWQPIFYMRAEYNYYKRLAKRKHKFYLISPIRSELEKESAEFYKSIGINHMQSNEDFSNNTMIFSDYVINIFIPEDIRLKIRELLSKRDKLNLITQALDKKTSIRVMIMKDSSLAKEIKQQTLKKF